MTAPATADHSPATGGSARGTIVLAAGGTGGHLFPAAALAHELAARDWHLALITDHRGAALPTQGLTLETHRVRAAAPRPAPHKLAGAIAALTAGALQARRRLTRLRPAAIVSFGSYASLPSILGAPRAIPVILHEQNAVLGRAHRFIAGRARLLATAFPETRRLPRGFRGSVAHTGNPVRAAIRAAAPDSYQPADAEGPFNLLIIGGSQGARVLSEVVPQAVLALPEPFRRRLTITQQARPEDLDRVRELYRSHNLPHAVEPFFDDMPQRYRQADLVIARAGASTVAELAVMRRPSVLVPLPTSADDHQRANALAVCDIGGGWVMDQSAFTPAMLAGRLEHAMATPQALAQAADSVARLAVDDAAAGLADMVESLAGRDAGARDPEARP